MRRIATFVCLAALASASGCAVRDMLARSTSYPRPNAHQEVAEENPWRQLEEDAPYGDL